MHCVLYTVHCTLCTVNYTRYTVLCALYTAHCTLFSIHGTLYSVHCTPYTVHSTLCTIHGTLYSVRCALYTVHCTLCTVHCALYTVHCTLCTVHCALYTVHCTLCTVHYTRYSSIYGIYKVYTLYSVRCALYTVHCTLCTVHCAPYTVHCTLCTVHYTRYTVLSSLDTVLCALHSWLFALLAKVDPKLWFETKLVEFDPKGVFSFRLDGESKKNEFWTQLDDLRQPSVFRYLVNPPQNGGMKPTSWKSIPRVFFRFAPTGIVEKTSFERNWTTFVNPAFCAAGKSPPKMVVWSRPRGIWSKGCFFVSPRWGNSTKRVFNPIGRPWSNRRFALLGKTHPKWWYETDLVEFDHKESEMV